MTNTKDRLEEIEKRLDQVEEAVLDLALAVQDGELINIYQEIAQVLKPIKKPNITNKTLKDILKEFHENTFEHGVEIFEREGKEFVVNFTKFYSLITQAYQSGQQEERDLINKNILGILSSNDDENMQNMRIRKVFGK